MTGNRSGHLLRPDIRISETIRLGPRQILRQIPRQISVPICLDKQSLSHALNVVINPYKLTLLLTASKEKAFLVKSIQAYSRYGRPTLKSIAYTWLTAAYTNTGTQ